MSEWLLSLPFYFFILVVRDALEIRCEGELIDFLSRRATRVHIPMNGCCAVGSLGDVYLPIVLVLYELGIRHSSAPGGIAYGGSIDHTKQF